MLFADKIRQLREQNSLTQKQIASELGIDVPMLSRIERGERPAKRSQVIKLANLFCVAEEDLINLWLADKVYDIVNDETDAAKVLSLVAEKIDTNDIR